jgi:hypothetical protein
MATVENRALKPAAGINDDFTASLPTRWQSEVWHSRQSRVTSPGYNPTYPDKKTIGHEREHHGLLVMRVATSLEPAMTTLRSVGWLVTGVSGDGP